MPMIKCIKCDKFINSDNIRVVGKGVTNYIACDYCKTNFIVYLKIVRGL